MRARHQLRRHPQKAASANRLVAHLMRVGNDDLRVRLGKSAEIGDGGFIQPAPFRDIADQVFATVWAARLREFTNRTGSRPLNPG